MSFGRKPSLSNVHYLPGINTPTNEHIDKAAILKPADIDDQSGAIWDRLAPEMMMLDRLKPHFVDAFAEYCYLLSRIANTRKKLAIEGENYTVIGRNGNQMKSRPELAQLNDDWRKLARLSSCFGLTPTDEKRLVGAIQGDLIDEFSEFA